VLRRVPATGIDPISFVLAHATASLALGAVRTAALLAIGTILLGSSLQTGLVLLAAVLGYLVYPRMGFTISG